MKTILLGISILLFGITLILVASGDAINIGLGTSFIGLCFSIFGFCKTDKE